MRNDESGFRRMRQRSSTILPDRFRGISKTAWISACSATMCETSGKVGCPRKAVILSDVLGDLTVKRDDRHRRPLGAVGQACWIET